MGTAPGCWAKKAEVSDTVRGWKNPGTFISDIPPRRLFSRLQNLGISGTSAKISRQTILDFIRGRDFGVFYQGEEGVDYGGDAKSALDSSFLDMHRLVCLQQRFSSQAFECGDTICRSERCGGFQATVHRPVVEKDGACAAFSLVGPFFGGQEGEISSEHPQEGERRGCGCFLFFPTGKKRIGTRFSVMARF
jgi:hypothetical protein